MITKEQKAELIKQYGKNEQRFRFRRASRSPS